MNRDRLTIWKVGGEIFADNDRCDKLIDEFAAIEGNKLLVHGGGTQLDSIGERLSVVSSKINGRRVTDSDTLDVALMVYAGLNNKRLVASLQRRGCNAIGLSGADGNLIPSIQRDRIPVDFGFVGDPVVDRVNTDLLRTLIDSSYVPVLCALTLDEKGQLLNTNADTIASTVASSLVKWKSVELHYVLDLVGVMSNPLDDSTLIREFKLDRLESSIESGTIVGGMLPKLENASSALSSGVTRVSIGESEILLSKKDSVEKG